MENSWRERGQTVGGKGGRQLAGWDGVDGWWGAEGRGQKVEGVGQMVGREGGGGKQLLGRGRGQTVGGGAGWE